MASRMRAVAVAAAAGEARVGRPRRGQGVQVPMPQEKLIVVGFLSTPASVV